MILANQMQKNKNTVREYGGIDGNTFSSIKPSIFVNRFTRGTQSTEYQLSGMPQGYNSEYSYSLPMKPGAIGATLSVVGSGGVSNANIWAVKLAEASISGDGSLTVFGSLIVNLIASMTGSGTVTSADIKAFLVAVANISGSGSASGPLGGLAELTSDTSGSGTLNGSTITALGQLIADIVVTGSGLTTANVGDAVWSAIAESGLTYEEVMRVLLAVAAGKTDIAGTTVTFRDVADTKDRVTATMTGSERTTVTLDGT